MDVIWQFICDHSHAIVELTLLICVLIVTLLKKKVRINDSFQSVLMVLPDLISLAESKFNNGSEKYSYVFNRCIEMLMQLTHKSSEKLLDEYTAELNAAIENILSTPQKKER